MKKKMMVIGAVAIIAVVAFFVGWYVMFVHFGRGPAFPIARNVVVEDQMIAGEIQGGEPLMALLDSEEEAKELAQQYGITFVSYQSGVATYDTDEDPRQVIERGKENGYSPLYLNQKRQMYDS